MNSKAIRRFGLHRLGQHLDEIPALADLARRIYGFGTADRVEKLLREAWDTRAEGAQATAVGIILGLEVGRRGARSAVLREVAARRLGYASVDTFRKGPEANSIAYFADVIEKLLRRLPAAPEQRRAPDQYRARRRDGTEPDGVHRVC